MTMISQELTNLFAEFERAIDAHDFEKIGELYADPFVSASPDGIIIRSRADFSTEARKASEFYKSIDQTSLKAISLEETSISDQCAIVKVRWGATFRKTGVKLVEFDDSYIVQKIGLEPRIIVLIAHQDEQKIPSELGLIDK